MVFNVLIDSAVLQTSAEWRSSFGTVMEWGREKNPFINDAIANVLIVGQDQFIKLTEEV